MDDQNDSQIHAASDERSEWDAVFINVDSATHCFKKALIAWDRMQRKTSEAHQFGDEDRYFATVAFQQLMATGREKIGLICKEIAKKALVNLRPSEVYELRKNILDYQTEYSNSELDLEALEACPTSPLEIKSPESDAYRNAATAALNFEHRLLTSVQVFIDKLEHSNEYDDILSLPYIDNRDKVREKQREKQ